MSLIICTHHKCASSFLYQYLRCFCEQNGLTIFTSHMGNAVPDSTCDVTFLSNATYAVLSPHLTGQLPALHVIRNPLAVVASGYFSHLKTHSTKDWPQLIDQRRVLECTGRAEGLHLTLAFLEKEEFYPRTPGPIRAMADWDYDDPRALTLRMEDVVANMDAFGQRLAGGGGTREMVLPEAGDFVFERFSGGRAPGVLDEGSHYRVGSPDAWREELPGDLIGYIQTRYHAFLARFYPEAL